MARDKQDFIMYIDSDGIIEFTVEDLGSIEEDYSAIWKMGRVDKQEFLIEKKSGEEEEEISFESNRMRVFYHAEDNKDLEVGEYYHEARLTDPDGNSRPVAYGEVRVKQTITSAPVS